MTGPVVIPLEAEENNNEKVINQDKKNIVEIKKPKPYTLRRKVKSRSRPPACVSLNAFYLIHFCIFSKIFCIPFLVRLLRMLLLLDPLHYHIYFGGCTVL